MPVNLEFEIEGEVQFARRLLIADAGVSDLSAPMAKIGSELRNSFDQNFSARGALFGGWPPRKKDKPWPLMERSGTLRKGFRDKVGSDFVVLFNETPYFKYHQSNKPRKRLPRRVMMLIDQERKQYIQKAVQEHITKIIRGGLA